LSNKTIEEAPSVTDNSILYFHDAGLTNTGLVRDHNEDAYKLPCNTNADILSAKGHLYVLADGMGGHQKGEVASAVTIDTVNAEYYTIVKSLTGQKDPETEIIKALSDSIQKANIDVLDETEGGGTTVVASVLFGDSLITMNVGDSRAYLLRDNTLYLLSRDHSLVSRLVEMGKITEEESLTHPRRNVLYQALGQGTEVDIHIDRQKLQLDDIIILCSDGLWGEVSETHLKRTLATAATPKQAAEQLIDQANASGGPDNITAVIIQISSREPSADNGDDTNPSGLARPKPTTLPEGKYHTEKND
jgi:serine/threonine protein phosphatase PrpC